MSYLEEELRLQIERAGLPAPVRELEYAKIWGKKWRVDFAWPAFRLMVEVDGGIELAGRGGHISPKGWAKDARKQAAAVLLGWRQIRVGKEHIHSGEALKWIKAALSRKYERADEDAPRKDEDPGAKATDGEQSTRPRQRGRGCSNQYRHPSAP